jgi:hypothetical protein
MGFETSTDIIILQKIWKFSVKECMCPIIKVTVHAPLAPARLKQNSTFKHENGQILN